jgi:hypothetical protein
MTVSEAVHSGGCLCGAVRFEIHGAPMIVHACHCTVCQRRTGSAFAVNLWIESDQISLLQGDLESRTAPGIKTDSPSESWFCQSCGTCLWAWYHASPANSRFVRAGTLDEPAAFSPDVHIFTSTKQPWVLIPENVPAFEAFYDLKSTWSDASRKRLRALMSSA